MVKLRAATMADWASLYAWRTDPATAAASPGEPPDLKTHMAWLRATLTNTKRVRLFVAYDPAQSGSVGTGRLDVREHGVVELSLTVDPQRRGQGYAQGIVGALVAHAREDGSCSRAVAKVRHDNAASLRAFAANGFLPSKYGELVTLERPL